ncbi:hypothetical protein VTN00DRAFT_3628 [Thermoascus crustaceus]|uniref:uncharacterized protein n=1 Tax=Thermoascus crustaceus TaxID=5088 RepID=UPI00374276FA
MSDVKRAVRSRRAAVRARRRDDGSPPGTEQPRWLAEEETRERRAPLAHVRALTDGLVLLHHLSPLLSTAPSSASQHHQRPSSMLCGWCSLASTPVTQASQASVPHCQSRSWTTWTSTNEAPASAKSAARSVANISNPILVFCDFLRTPACVFGLCSGHVNPSPLPGRRLTEIANPRWSPGAPQAEVLSAPCELKVPEAPTGTLRSITSTQESAADVLSDRDQIWTRKIFETQFIRVSVVGVKRQANVTHPNGGFCPTGFVMAPITPYRNSTSHTAALSLRRR